MEIFVETNFEDFHIKIKKKKIHDLMNIMNKAFMICIDWKIIVVDIRI